MLDLLAKGENPKDDGVMGIALVYEGVAGRGHKPIPIKKYIADQLLKDRSDQSFRTTARGLRELYELLGFITREDDEIRVTDLGRSAALYANKPLDQIQTDFWRSAIRNMEHYGGEETFSHPYQVMLRLIAQRPGISRARCALALEASDDSAEELDRILQLSDLEESEIRLQIGVSKNNWNNAKKILPKFAEQLGDVVKISGSFYLADAPGERKLPFTAEQERKKIRAPRSARSVTAETIGRAGTAGDFSDEVEISPLLDAEARARGIRIRRTRLRRHNLLVQELASKLIGDPEIYEDPFDLFAVFPEVGILIEVKTLDGKATDERDRVRDALSQLLYYEAFVATPMAGEHLISKIACFESDITAEHKQFLNKLDIGVMWKSNDALEADKLARAIIWNRIKKV